MYIAVGKMTSHFYEAIQYFDEAYLMFPALPVLFFLPSFFLQLNYSRITLNRNFWALWIHFGLKAFWFKASFVFGHFSGEVTAISVALPIITGPENGTCTALACRNQRNTASSSSSWLQSFIFLVVGQNFESSRAFCNYSLSFEIVDSVEFGMLCFLQISVFDRFFSSTSV